MDAHEMKTLMRHAVIRRDPLRFAAPATDCCLAWLYDRYKVYRARYYSAL